MTYEQFRYAFANAVSKAEARQLYDTFAVPASGPPIFQAATANLNPRTQVKVDTKNGARGPMLIVGGEKDHVIPPSVAHAAYKRQKHNLWKTEFVVIPERGHTLTIDDGWHHVANAALAFTTDHV